MHNKTTRVVARNDGRCGTRGAAHGVSVFNEATLLRIFAWSNQRKTRGRNKSVSYDGCEQFFGGSGKSC